MPELRPGVTTVDQAIAKLGQPISVTVRPGGSQLLRWSGRRGAGGHRPLAVLFDASGHMLRIAKL